MSGSTLFIVSNVLIASGYYILGLGLYRLLRRFMRINAAIIAGAFWFFLACAATHVEMAYHEANYPTTPVAVLDGSTHMLLIHAVQAVAVWTFVAGILWALFQMEATDRRTAERLRAARKGDDSS